MNLSADCNKASVCFDEEELMEELISIWMSALRISIWSAWLRILVHV